MGSVRHTDKAAWMLCFCMGNKITIQMCSSLGMEKMFQLQISPEDTQMRL